MKFVLSVLVTGLPFTSAYLNEPIGGMHSYAGLIEIWNS